MTVNHDNAVDGSKIVPIDVDREVKARLAGWMGLLSLALLMTGTCTCLGTWPVAAFIAIPATWAGANMRADLDISPAGRAFAGVGAVSGAIALLLIGITGLALMLLLLLQVGGLVELADLAR
ncbi:MAG: hypothetical protein ACI9MC_000769 [Kiritimatiellia bacterium]|jgi:hypothetical protein